MLLYFPATCMEYVKLNFKTHFILRHFQFNTSFSKIFTCVLTARFPRFMLPFTNSKKI